jgi:pyruvate/2-oxoglutarate dehydrogenase complex dihydrolipoamide dehydrogenase (E3) component
MQVLGITLHHNKRVTACLAPESGPITLDLKSGRVLQTEAVLVATGRISNTEHLTLEAAGVVVDERG